MSIDPRRLARALHFDVDRCPSGWLVNGRMVHEETGCVCPDRTVRGGPCKHELAVRLAAVDAEILDALRELVSEEAVR